MFLKKLLILIHTFRLKVYDVVFVNTNTKYKPIVGID